MKEPVKFKTKNLFLCLNSPIKYFLSTYANSTYEPKKEKLIKYTFYCPIVTFTFYFTKI